MLANRPFDVFSLPARSNRNNADQPQGHMEAGCIMELGVLSYMSAAWLSFAFGINTEDNHDKLPLLRV